MDAAMDGDTVLVSPGTYEGPGNINLNPRGVSLVIRSVAGPESTIIRLRSASSTVSTGFSVRSGETQPMEIQGFTLSDGEDHSAVAIVCVASRLLVQDCRIVGSVGAALDFQSSNVAVVRCSIRQMASSMAPIDVRGGTVRFDQCVMNDNYSLQEGGALRIEAASVVLSRCEIMENWCGSEPSGAGGALRLYHSSVSLDHCLIARNRAAYLGGAICADDTALSINYSTISENHGGDFGGAIEAWNVSLTMENSIMTANAPDDIHADSGVLWFSRSAVDTTSIRGHAAFRYDATVITADPELCRLSGIFSSEPSDYHLRPGSPCLTPYRIGALPAGCDE